MRPEDGKICRVLDGEPFMDFAGRSHLLVKAERDAARKKALELVEEDETVEEAILLLRDTAQDGKYLCTPNEMREAGENSAQYIQYINEFLTHELYINEIQRAEIETELHDAHSRISKEESIGKNLILIIILNMLLDKQVLHVDELTEINKAIKEEPRIALNPDETYLAIESTFILIVGNGFAQKIEN